MTVKKNAVLFLSSFALLSNIVWVHTIHIHVRFLNSFGTHSLISAEMKQNDIDLKDYYISIHSVEI